jgi:hypothetical protein
MGAWAQRPSFKRPFEYRLSRFVANKLSGTRLGSVDARCARRPSGYVQAAADRERIQQSDQESTRAHPGHKQKYVSVLRATCIVRHGSPPIWKANAGPCELFRQRLLADEQQRSEADPEDRSSNHRNLPAGQIPQRLQNIGLRLPERHHARFAISVSLSGHA